MISAKSLTELEIECSLLQTREILLIEEFLQIYFNETTLKMKHK